MDLNALDYELPRELIADRPADRRDESRLLVLRRESGEVEHRIFRDLPEYLRPQDVLVLNDTRVVRARIRGRRATTGGRWQGLFVQEVSRGQWLIMARSRGRLQPGERLSLGDTGQYELRLLARREGGLWLAELNPPLSAPQVLDVVGDVPLPPYIKRSPHQADQEWYQTVYAREPGAVAAPTAGLHFTVELLDRIREMGVGVVYVTLHVGPGTFQPVKVQDLSQHRMHTEWCRVSPQAVHQILDRRRAGGRVVAVGTTVVRTLETAAREGELRPFEGTTDLFIKPPFTFRVVDALITNFHLPRSTLLALVFAFAGEERIRRAYAEAIQHRYRFYSYGDAMLIL